MDFRSGAGTFIWPMTVIGSVVGTAIAIAIESETETAMETYSQ